MGDFGLAYSWDDPDATANAIGPIGPIGTPRYMAPEQLGADRDRLGPAADIYGLGALLYHVMTGRPPFVAPSVAETLEQVRHQEPVPPRRLIPAIPRDLETICLKCLRKEPGQRYATARAVADDLRRFLDGVAISTRPDPPAVKAWRWCRRRPAVAALAAALAFTFFAGFLGMFRLWRHAESERGRAERERSRAEEAQARAEADLGHAAGLLDQLIELNAGGQHNLPKVVSPERMITLLQGARRDVLELARRLPHRETMLLQLNSVNDRLGVILSEESRWDEVRHLHESSLREAEDAIRQLPRADFPRGWRLSDLTHLAQLAEKEGKPEEVEAHLTRAIACSEEWTRAAPGPAPSSHWWELAANWRDSSPNGGAATRPGTCCWPMIARSKRRPGIGSMRGSRSSASSIPWTSATWAWDRPPIRGPMRSVRPIPWPCSLPRTAIAYRRRSGRNWRCAGSSSPGIPRPRRPGRSSGSPTS